jgi:hypothetical protein
MEGFGVIRRFTNVFAALAIAAAFASRGAAQQTHVLIISGLGAEQPYIANFQKAAHAVYEAAKKWNVPDASLIYLSADSMSHGVTGKATKAEVENAFTALAKRAGAGDVVLVYLVGHGSGEGIRSAVNVSGPDPTAADYKMWVSLFPKQTVVFVNASSASGDFVDQMKQPGHIVITATKTAMERNESVFAAQFSRALSTEEADSDKDGRISVLEAFEFTRKEVARFYENEKKLQTEHALLSDSILAKTVAFGGQPSSADPKVAALVAERRALEDSLNTLRGRKAQMDPAEYEKELERLLLAIAEKTQAIRAAGGRE